MDDRFAEILATYDGLPSGPVSCVVQAVGQEEIDRTCDRIDEILSSLDEES